MAMKAFMEPMGTELVCEDPFDSIDDLLDFPNDDEGLPMAEAWESCSPLPPAPAPAMITAGSGGGISVGSAAGGLDGRTAGASCGGISSENDALGLYNDMDIANLEWLSNFFEDSEFNLDFIPTPTDTKPEHKSPSLSRSSSPISVLLLPTTSSSSSSSSSSNSITETSPFPPPPPPPPPPPASVPARARTKRPRLPSFSVRTFIPPSSNTPISSPTAVKKMKKDPDSVPSVRKCSHCEIQKTPQWRAGPMGPKTLCNACGVRYKSGRLFPEYRPAASPTFVPAVHSNSHKKVVEMRLRCTDMAGKNGGRDIPVAAKNCDLLEYIRRRD